jgi:hypothetical protein
VLIVIPRSINYFHILYSDFSIWWHYIIQIRKVKKCESWTTRADERRLISAEIHFMRRTVRCTISDCIRMKKYKFHK